MKDAQAKLTFGEIFGGPDVRGSSIDHATKELIYLSDEFSNHSIPSQSAKLNVVFHVPGSLLKPEFVGVRTGTLSRKENKMMVQVAVPENLVNSPNVRHFLFEYIREAIRIAKPKFAKFKIFFAESEFLALVDRMENVKNGHSYPP